MSYSVTHIDELDRIPVAHGLEWRPVRRRFGVRAFGVNAYTSAEVGGWVVEEHTEERPQHEELYVVVSGRARFTVGDAEFDAPAGTLVHVADPSLLRKAVSEEEGTTVLAIGGKPGEAFTPSVWEWYFVADQQSPEDAVATLEDGLRELGDIPALYYHLARAESRAGRTDDARAHLQRALADRADLREHAANDDHLKGLLS